MGSQTSVCQSSSDSIHIQDEGYQNLKVQDTGHENHSEGVIRFVVNSAVQKLSGQKPRLFSPVQYINNLPWKVMVERKDSSLGVFLYFYGTEYDSNYKVYAEFSFRLVSQKFSESLTESGHHEFERGGTGHGFSHFADFDKLLDPNRYFLRANTITIECHVACSSLLKVISVNSSKDAALETFMQVNDLSSQHQLDRARYILQNGIGSDCEFIIDGSPDKKRVSKAILARVSSVFEHMFFKDEGCDSYCVSDISCEVFDVMLQHIYGVLWEFQSKPQAIELYYAACKYKLTDLKMMCIQFIWPTSLDDAWVALDCGVRFELEELQEAALALLRKSAAKAFEMEEFLNLSLPCLVLILKQTNLSISSELKVFNAVFRWACSSCVKKNMVRTGSNLRSELGEAIRHIRFLSMTEAQFAGRPCESGVLTEEEKAAVFQRLTTKKKVPMLSELSGITLPRQT